MKSVAERLGAFNFPWAVVSWRNFEARSREVFPVRAALSDVPFSVSQAFFSENGEVFRCALDEVPEDEAGRERALLGWWFDGVFVCKRFFRAGMSREYFESPVAGRFVYAPLAGSGRFLPTGGTRYIVRDEKLCADAGAGDYDVVFKRVFVQDEVTLGELYGNACGYSYVREADAFLPLPEEGRVRNELECLRVVTTLREVGSLEERFEAALRLLVFALGRVWLSEDEERALAGVLECAKMLGPSEVAAAAFDVEGALCVANAAREGAEALRKFCVYDSALLMKV